MLSCIIYCPLALRADTLGFVSTKNEITLVQCNGAVYRLAPPGMLTSCDNGLNLYRPSIISAKDALWHRCYPMVIPGVAQYLILSSNVSRSIASLYFYFYSCESWTLVGEREVSFHSSRLATKTTRTITGCLTENYRVEQKSFC